MAAKKTSFTGLDRNKTLAENTVNAGPVLLDSNVTLTSPDTAGFQNGTFSVKLTNATADDDLTLAEVGGITVEQDPESGKTLVFYNGVRIGTEVSSGQNGAALTIQLDQSVDNVEATALARAVAYSSSSNTPSSAARALTYTASDSDGTVASATMQLKIKGENDASIISGLGPRSSHEPSAAAIGVVIDGDAQVVNPDGTGFKGGKLTVHIGNGATADQLYLSSGPFSITGNKLYLAGVQVGSVSANGVSGHDLSFTFKSNVALSDAQMSALIEQVSYRSTASTPPTPRDVTFTVTDAEKSAVSTHVTLAFENQAPTFLSASPAGAITLVSTSAGGEHGNGASFGPAISANGVEVAFVSTSANFSDSAATFRNQIFVKKLSTGAITLVSADAAGVAGNVDTPSIYGRAEIVISPDGHKVAFVSAASNLVPGDTNGTEDVFVKDLNTGAITRVSTDSSGAQISAGGGAPNFSPDGTKIAFWSGMANLAGDTNGSGLYVKDLTTGVTTQVAINQPSANNPTSGSEPVFSPDGTKIAFVAFGNDHGPSVVGGSPCIYVKDLATGDVTYVSAASTHELIPVFSPDGTKIAFVSNQSSVVPGGESSGTQLYVKDLVTGEITCVSTQGMIHTGDVIGDTFSFSADGTKIVFSSTTADHVDEHGNGIADIFVADLQTGTVTRVTTNTNGASTSPVFTPDGAHVIFTSDASNLVSGDKNNVSDIFMASLDTPSVMTATLTEDAAKNALTAAGTVYFADPDMADTHTVSVTAPQDALGTLSAKVVSDVNGSGAVVWSYAVDETKVEPLAAGESREETFTLNLSDGHGGTVAQNITVTLTGAGEGAPSPAVATFALAEVDTAPSRTADADLWASVVTNLSGQSDALLGLLGSVGTRLAAQDGVLSHLSEAIAAATLDHKGLNLGALEHVATTHLSATVTDLLESVWANISEHPATMRTTASDVLIESAQASASLLWDALHPTHDGAHSLI